MPTPLSHETPDVFAPSKDSTSLLDQDDFILSDQRPSRTVPFRRRGKALIPSITIPGADCIGIKGPQVRKLKPAQSVLRWFLQGRCGLEELLLQLHFGHLSMAAVEMITVQLWGEKPVLIYEAIPSLLLRLDQWLQRPVGQKFPYIFVHASEIPRRRSSAEKGACVAVVAGINGNGCRELLGVHVASAGSRHFWDTLFERLGERGIVGPQFVIGDVDMALRAAVARCWPLSRWLPFDSGLEQELLRGVGFNDRHLVWDLMAKFRSAAGAAQARLAADEMVNRLKSSGYPSLSVEMKGILKDHRGYFEIPPAHRTELRKLEFLRTELSRLREQLRIIGPVPEHEVLVRFAAATFRRACRRSWEGKPVLAFD